MVLHLLNSSADRTSYPCLSVKSRADITRVSRKEKIMSGGGGRLTRCVYNIILFGLKKSLLSDWSGFDFFSSPHSPQMDGHWANLCESGPLSYLPHGP